MNNTEYSGDNFTTFIIDGPNKNASKTDPYKGYIVDLLRKMTQYRIGNETIAFRMQLVKDNKYGSRIDECHYNGLLGEVGKGVSQLHNYITIQAQTFQYLVSILKN